MNRTRWLRRIAWAAAVILPSLAISARGEDPVSVKWIDEDTETRGNWVGTYGACAYILPDPPGQMTEFAADQFTQPVGFGITNTASHDLLIKAPYLWTPSQVAGLYAYELEPTYGDEFWSDIPDFTYEIEGTLACEDPQTIRSLTGPEGASTRAAAFFGTDFDVLLDLPAGTYELSLYMVDWDTTNRVEVALISADGASEFIEVSDFGDGVYAKFFVHLPTSQVVDVNVTQTGGANGVISGVFLDSTLHAPTNTVMSEIALLGDDSQTQGLWVGAYGELGYILAGWNAPTTTKRSWERSLDLAGGMLTNENYWVTSVPATAKTVFAWNELSFSDYYVTCVQYPGFEWAWEPYTSAPTDPRAAYFPSKEQWRATVWDDGGERKKPINGYLNFHLFFPEGSYQLALYTYDYERTYRESMEFVIYDENGAELVRQQVAGSVFDEGVYEIFQVLSPPGGAVIIVRLYNDKGYSLTNINVLLAGIFVDCGGGGGGGDRATIGDRVWDDVNANGIQDQGEVGIDGVIVNLYKSGVVGLIGSTTTDDAGQYLFSGLIPGEYHVQFVPSSGYLFSPRDHGVDDLADSDVDEASGLTVMTSLAANEVDLSWDAGLYRLGSIGDFVWNDANANGVQDAGETGIPGVTANLFDAGHNVVKSVATDPDGKYLFSDLIPGDYYVGFATPSGYAFSSQDKGGNDAVDSDVAAASGVTGVIALASGEDDLSWDAGLYKLGAIGDWVWHDSDVDGVQDAGEAGLEGVEVLLLDAQGAEMASTVTDSIGYYEFTGLLAGSYSVKIDDSSFLSGGPLQGWYASPRDRGTDDGKDSDGNTTTHVAAVALAQGQVDRTIDFGFFHTCVQIEKTGPATAQSGQTITYHFRLWNCGDVVLHGGAQVYDAMLKPDGDHMIWSGVVQPGQVYEFDRTYCVKTTDCGTLVNTAKAIGHPQHPDGYYLTNVQDTDTWTVEVICPQDATLGDFVWKDANANGIQDSGEAGIAGVTVKLFDSANNLVDTETTDAGGKYLFTDVVPGNYYVQFVAPAGYSFSPKDQGGNDAKDSDADPATGKTVMTKLDPGENDLTWDAGLRKRCGTQGLTPGFWKQSQHFMFWVGYKTTDRFNTVFGVNVSGNPTLLQALSTGGGGYQALNRQAVAALLNAMNPRIDYLYGPATVISMVQQAYATGKYDATKNLLEKQNTKENVNLK